MMAIGKRAILRLAKMLRSGRFLEKLERGMRFAGRGKDKIEFLEGFSVVVGA